MTAMQLLRKFIVLCTAAALMAGMLTGCGQTGDNRAVAESPRITDISNHLGEWQQDLPREKEDSLLSSSSVRGMVVRKGGGDVLAISYEPREEKESFDYWDISVPYQSLVSVNTEELYQLFELAVQINGGEHKSADISLQEAGLEESGTSLFIAYNSEQQEGEKGVPEPTAARNILIGKEDGKGNYYAVSEGEQRVYLVDKSMTDAVLNADPYQYILKIPVLVSVNSVSQVNILLPDEETHVMKQSEDKWIIDQEEVEQEKFQEQYGKLLGIMITGELPEDFKPDTDRKPVLTLQFLRNAKGASDIEVKYYEYDKEHMSVSVNGMERFLVDGSDIQNLRKLSSRPSTSLLYTICADSDMRVKEITGV